MNRLVQPPGFPFRLACYILALLAFGIAISGVLYYQVQKRTIQQQRNDELGVIADLKAREIEDWRRERLVDAEFVRQTSFTAEAIARVLTPAGTPQLEQDVLGWMRRYKDRHGYANIVLVDAIGNARLSLPPETPPLEPEALSLVARAMTARTAVLSDLHLDAGNAVHMDLAVPVSLVGNAAPLAALLIRIDPRTSLYRLIERWPAPSRTAETLLLRWEGNEVLYLNELRYRKVPPLSYRSAAFSVVASGPREVGEIDDYRGVLVVETARPVRDCPWILVAKVDREEIYGALWTNAVSIGALGFLLFAGAVTGLLLLWREQQGRFYQREYAAEIVRQGLAERLDNLSRYATDIMLLADTAGRLLDANESAVVSYGYERHDLLRLTMGELMPPEARSGFERQWAQIMEEGGLVFESDQQRKDSSVFPAVVSSRLVGVGGDMCCQSFVHDISGRRAVEERSRLLESAMLQTSDGVLIVEVCGEYPCRPNPIFVNSAFERMTGYSLEDLRARPTPIWYAPGSPLHLIEQPCGEFGHCPSHLDQPVWRKDGSAFRAEWDITPLVDKSGRATHCVWTCRDITERVRADEASRFLSSIVESSDDAIIGKNTEGIVLSWNQGAERIYGYSSRDMVGQPISTLLPPDRHDELPEIIEKLKQGRSIQHFETERVRKDGRRIFVSLTISAIKDRANQIVGASVIARDISEQKRAGEQLALAHRRTSAILESISDGFNTFDREWNYTYVNPAAAKLVGKTPEELLGRNLWELWPHSAASPFGVAYRRAVAENVQVHVEAFYAEPLNRWFEVRAYPSPEGLTLFFNDTTERKRADKALALSEERYRSLTLATAQIVWTANPSGEVDYDLPMWRAFTGQSPEQVWGWGRFDALHPEDSERTADLWSRAVRNRSFFDTEYRLHRHDGEYRWMAVHGVPVLDEAGRIREWVGTCADITERKLAEEEIRRLNHDLEQRVLQRTTELQEANRELEAFAYSVSHDLRAPLRAVDGFSRILLDEYAPQLPQEAQHYLQVAHKNAVQMGELIDGLLKFSRLGRQPLCKQPIATADLVHQAWEDLHAEHERRQVEIEVGDLAPCEGDALLLKQVFVNLLSNALKYTRAREIARIEVGCISTGLQTCYFVRDNGVGFDIRYRDKLFGVFQRLHRVEDYEGTGVGLATVQRIVHRHGGQVWADAILNQGAAFYFTLSSAANPGERNENHDG